MKSIVGVVSLTAFEMQIATRIATSLDSTACNTACK